jgi:mono/diheme cytochrome c family protein
MRMSCTFEFSGVRGWRCGQRPEISGKERDMFGRVRSLGSFRVVFVCAVAVWMLGAAGEGSAQVSMGSGEPPAFQAVKGRVTYRTYCASCHGEKGDGRGNLASYLNVDPADLRQLAIANGGEFPHLLVKESIDGRRFVAGHGTREMPVWGEVFQSPMAGDPDDLEGSERAECRICELVYFLETIQVDEQGGE